MFMALSVLICDDSKFARRQMARCLPSDWDVSVSFAENGEDALAQIEQGLGDLVFLDLTMPVMDGYETLRQIRQRDLQTMVIVVSGDVQQKAKQDVMALGAMDFLEKPIHGNTLKQTLVDFGLYTASGDELDSEQASDNITLEPVSESERLDVYQEMVNIAMGVAGKNLSSVLDEFISLPVPIVNYIAASEIAMAIHSVQQDTSVSGISQGFVCKGINGEAILIFNDADFSKIIALLNYPQDAEHQVQELEALMDIGNILIGACVGALGEQLHLQFSLTHPVILGQHTNIDSLLNTNVSRMKKVLAIEIAYSIKALDIKFELLLLFPESSMTSVMHLFLEGKVDP